MGISTELSPGAMIERYRLCRLLGQGGMGLVWAAIDTTTLEMVALKLVKHDKGGDESRRRLLREARAASAVRHPNVRQIRDVLELEDGRPVIVMEYLLGESLKERLRRERTIPLTELAGLFLQVVSAVGKAHEIGVIHRDLTPANIFLPTEAGGAVKVLDFGIAKLIVADDPPGQASCLTTSGAMLGTPCYMSPEQVFGRADIDHRTDIWSLGIILYEALSGILPTKGENIGQVLKQVVHPIRQLRDVAPEVPAPVANLIMAMIVQPREARLSDLRELEALLSQYALPSFGPPKLRATPCPPTAEPANSVSSGEGAATVDPDAERIADLAARLGANGLRAVAAIDLPARTGARTILAIGGVAVLVAVSIWALIDASVFSGEPLRRVALQAIRIELSPLTTLSSLPAEGTAPAWHAADVADGSNAADVTDAATGSDLPSHGNSSPDRAARPPVRAPSGAARGNSSSAPMGPAPAAPSASPGVRANQRDVIPGDIDRMYPPIQ